MSTEPPVPSGRLARLTVTASSNGDAGPDLQVTASVGAGTRIEVRPGLDVHQGERAAVCIGVPSSDRRGSELTVYLDDAQLESLETEIAIARRTRAAARQYHATPRAVASSARGLSVVTDA